MTSSFLSHQSLFGPHILDAVNVWTCDGIANLPTFVGGNNFRACSSIETANWSCESSVSFPTTYGMFTGPFSDAESNHEWSNSGSQSSGKDMLISTDDDGWNDLEATLTSTLTHRNLQDDATLEAPVTLDSRGRREITGVALHEELKHFSGVVRLQTLMEIFKVDSFSHMVEFFSVLQTGCNMIFDPKVGTMVIFRKHLYVPARKVVVKHEGPHIFECHREMTASSSILQGSRRSKCSMPRFVTIKPPSPIDSKGRVFSVSSSIKPPVRETVFDFADTEESSRKQSEFRRCDEKISHKRSCRRANVRRRRPF